MEKVYIQTYSVREALDDYRAGIQRLADMGYYGIEFAGGYGGLDTAEMKALLKNTGLDAISSHVQLNNAEKDMEFLAEVGARYIICPMARFSTYEEAMNLAEEMNRLGGIAKGFGLKFGYHNHTQEFALVNGKYLLEHLIDNTDPSQVVFQLDVGWCTTAGVDPVEFINKHGGRFELIHAKEAGKVTGVEPPRDMSKVQRDENGRPIFTAEMKAAMMEKRKMNSPMGKGLVDWKAVKAAADAQGAKAYIVEREYDYLNDIFQCVKEDVDFLKTV